MGEVAQNSQMTEEPQSVGNSVTVYGFGEFVNMFIYTDI